VALRIKSQWHDDETERSLAEVAGALAFITWRLALDKAINLHCERYVYDDDAQRLAVIQEYLCFLVQITDRLAYDRLDPEQRRELVVGLAKRLAEHVQDNGVDLLGPGEHGRGFIDRLGERSAEYAEFRMTDEGPSYPFLRHLGYSIQSLMGEEAENRWVIDQVMDRDGWDLYRQLAKALHELLG
jgi:hypothetical protein